VSANFAGPPLGFARGDKMFVPFKQFLAMYYFYSFLDLFVRGGSGKTSVLTI
jgi:hypothetical protein